MKHTRYFAPAYLAPTGIIIAIGTPTRSLKYARDEAKGLRSSDDETDIFVAFRDVPALERLNE